MSKTTDKLNPMFNRKNPKRAPLIQNNKHNNPTKERKKRSDAKDDVKIPLDERNLKRIRILARQRKMSPTSCAAFLIKQGLSYNMEFDEVKYVNTPNTVHAKLDQDTVEQLFKLDLEWNYRSKRKTAHRILVNMINFLYGEVTIIESV